MEIVREISNYKNIDQSVYLALGNFDGIHVGHRKLLEKAVKTAEENQGIATAFIFDPHPSKVIGSSKELKLITKPDKKAELLQEIGFKLLIYNSFNEEISKWQPEEFVEKIIVSKLKAKHVFVGFNYSFGHKGRGNPQLLKELGKQHGFAVSVIPPVTINDTIISSSLIREMIENGQVKEAYKLLGYYPMVEGLVVHGDKRGGDKIGFPTANLEVDNDLIIPAKGVYAAKVICKGKSHNCVVNVGNKPTFHKEHPLTVEAHIIEFNRDIYGENLQVYFLDRIRDEMKFENIASLAKQINQDKDIAHKIASKI